MTKEISLTQGKVALVDDRDCELVGGLSWYAYKSGNNWYAARILNGKHITMQNFIMGKKDELIWDHKNRNGLDNRRCNLRLATRTQNIINSRKRKNSSSKYKGVSFYKRDGTWQSNIRVNKELIYLGRFDDEVEAAKIYDDAARKHFREFATLNFWRGES